MECEICGRETSKVYEVNVDGAQMLACEKCAGGRGTLVKLRKADERKVSISTAPATKVQGQEELVEDFGEKIRQAREKMGLPLKVLAEMISEKASTLIRIEKQKTLPSEKTRVKLEKELGIKLISKSTEKQQVASPKKNEPVTLWDLVGKKEGQGE